MSEVVEIALFTDDVDGLRAFYERVLLAAPEASWPGGAVYAAGPVKLLVHERSATADGPPDEDHVAIGVADVDSACLELGRHGIDVLVEARDYPWGRSAYLRDPDGRLVELAQA